MMPSADVLPLLGWPGTQTVGDDYLGGALVALRAVGHRMAQMWSAIAPFAFAVTNDISFAHLSAAAEGTAAALHALIK